MGLGFKMVIQENSELISPMDIPNLHLNKEQFPLKSSQTDPPQQRIKEQHQDRWIKKKKVEM